MARDRTEDDGPKPKINLAGTIPPDPANGLLSILGDICREPGKRRVAIIEYDAQWVRRITDTAQLEPCIRIRQIEPVTPDSEETAAKMLRESMAARGAQLTLDQSLAD